MHRGVHLGRDPRRSLPVRTVVRRQSLGPLGRGFFCVWLPNTMSTALDRDLMTATARQSLTLLALLLLTLLTACKGCGDPCKNIGCPLGTTCNEDGDCIETG